MLCWSIIATRCDGCSPELLESVLRPSGARLLNATSDDQLIEFVERHSPECAVVLAADSLNGDTLLTVERIRQIDHSCPLLILTSSVQTETALAAMRSGASDMLALHAPGEEILASLERISARRQRYESQRSDPCLLVESHRLVGSCPVIARIRAQIARVAATDANVLITGESGTGKELVAELIHRNSHRSAGPFVAVNCAAIPDSLLESELFGHEKGAFTGATAARDGKLHAAAAGTLFLDEIGDMSMAAQAKILRAIEQRVVQRLGSNVDSPVRFRVVAATNQNLEVLVGEKKFRQDLYFRLNVVRMELPALRDHAGDIPELTESILRELSRRQRQPEPSLQRDLLRRLQHHDWPGNVRELRNILESILVYCSSSSIALADVPAHIRQNLSSHNLYPDERSKILSALVSTDWNRQKASEILHCSRMTLYRKMIRYSISDSKF